MNLQNREKPKCSHQTDIAELILLFLKILIQLVLTNTRKPTASTRIKKKITVVYNPSFKCLTMKLNLVH